MTKPPALPALCEWRMVSTREAKPTAKWIAARVLAMQSHFYQPELTVEIEKLAMTDWIVCLKDIPQAAVEQAFAARLQSSRRYRPTPGEIRQDALGRVLRPAKPLKLAPPPVVYTNEQLQERRAICQRLHEEFPKLWRMPTPEGV